LIQTCRLAHLSVGRSVCLSVRRVYCGKTTDWMWVPFGVVTGVGRGMGVLDWGGDRRRRRGSFEGKRGASHCNKRGTCVVILCREGWRRGSFQTTLEFLIHIVITAQCICALQIGFTFLILPFWCRLTRVVPDKNQEGRQTVVCVYFAPGRRAK